MSRRELPSVAVIADAHCHDMDSDYGFTAAPLAGRAQATLRSWQDSRGSSRVFNESVSALQAAVDDIERRGIRHVVLLGDYTDDGQIEATRRLRERLLDYQRSRGLSFYAIPGNHDCYGPRGKHQSTRFVSTPEQTVLVSSDPAVAATEDSAILSPAMFCEATPQGVTAMGEFGLFRQAQYLHWETPFGSSDAIENRCHEARSADGQVHRQLVDASYLVEPVDGLWLLMIDANVFEPRNGQRHEAQKKAFIDSSDAGWTSLLRNRPHLLPWISAVCERARTAGKQLLSFSHYPTMDPFDDHSDSEIRLFGHTDLWRRRPSAQVARTLLKAGMPVHFGGHLHVNSYRQIRSDDRQLTDIAVPSLVAFPPAYSIIHTRQLDTHVETAPIGTLALNAELLDYYRAEQRATGAAEDQALQSDHYGEFLYQRMRCRTQAHHLPHQWPADLAAAVPGSNAAMLALLLLAQRLTDQPLSLGAVPAQFCRGAQRTLATLSMQDGISLDELEDCDLTQLITDWYCLRQAGHQACSFFTPAHLDSYRFLARHFGDLSVASIDTQADFMHLFLGVLQQSMLRAIPGSSLSLSLETLL